MCDLHKQTTPSVRRLAIVTVNTCHQARFPLKSDLKSLCLHFPWQSYSVVKLIGNRGGFFFFILRFNFIFDVMFCGYCGGNAYPFVHWGLQKNIKVLSSFNFIPSFGIRLLQLTDNCLIKSCSICYSQRESSHLESERKNKKTNLN